MGEKRLVLGIDIGIASVGWGIIDENNDIVDAGVRLFEESDVKSNSKRREKRSGRRVKRRRQHRLVRMRRLLVRHGIIDNETFHSLPNPYQIRVKGLREKLTHPELATAVLHIAKRRGSDWEVVESESSDAAEEKKAKAHMSENSVRLRNENKHICELQLERLMQSGGKIRGEMNVFQSDDYVNEATEILKNQDIEASLADEILKIIKTRRHYSEGPGSFESPTSYGRYRLDEEGNVIKVNLIEQMRGKCSVFEDELRAPEQSFSAELFNYLNDLNNLSIEGEKTKITKEQKEHIIAEIKKTGYLKPKTDQVRALAQYLDIASDLISGFRIDSKGNPLLSEFKGYQKLLKVMRSHDVIIPERILDEIAVVLTSHKTKEDRIEHLADIIEQSDLIESFAELTGFTRYHSLSLKAIYLINEVMIRENKNQMQVITEKELRENKPIGKLALDDSAILSSVARRAHRQALRVIDCLQRKYGYFDRIVVETTREKNSQTQRENIKKIIERNRDKKRRIEDMLKNHLGEYQEPKGQQILKLLLYVEQDGKCAYTYNPLNLDAILGNRDHYETDHIIPRSISLDNSMNNRVLCEHKVNQIKDNATPYDYFRSGRAYGAINTFDAFKKMVLANRNYSREKKNLLLFQHDITKYDVLETFINRNLVDTSYAIRSFMTTLKGYFKSNGIPSKVFTVRGKVTRMFRNIGMRQFAKDHPHSDENPLDRHYLDKNRDEYRHHALDALIVARISEQSIFKEMLKTNDSQRVNLETGEILEGADPQEDSEIIKFVKNLANANDEDIKYSWKVDKKPNRQFADETIYSTRVVEGNHRVVKKYRDIYNLDRKTVASFFEDENKKKSLLIHQNDPQTFEILEKIYHQYKDVDDKKVKNPFTAYLVEHGEKIRKYAKHGNGPWITDIKYIEDTLGVHMDISDKYDSKNKKIVHLQMSPYRTDFYKNPDGAIKFLTVRRIHLKQTRDRYYIPQHLYDSLKRDKKIEDNADFLFSVNRNEIIEIINKTKENTTSEMYRFIATSADKTNAIEVKSIHQRDEKTRIIKTIGRKTLNVAKYAVSPIGEVRRVENEQLKLII